MKCKHDAILHLNALGYTAGEIVTGRNIHVLKASNIDWAGILTEDNIIIRRGTWKSGSFNYDGETYEDGLSWLDEQNFDRGIYINVNGGRDNISVKRFYAVFFEHDKGTHAEQWELIQKFPILPTSLLLTLRSSHTYFTIFCQNPEDYQNLNLWSEYQEKIAYAMGSDPAVKDKPRLMRLAGFAHVRKAEYYYDGGEFDYFNCELKICDEGRRYTLEQIDNAINEFCKTQGIKTFTKERFSGYQYVTSKLNQKKTGVSYNHPKFDPNLFRYCNDGELEELLFRAKNFARLCERRHKGQECAEPETAWTSPIKEIKAQYAADFDFPTVAASPELLEQAGIVNESLPHYFARKYGIGFTGAGQPGARSHWAVCQCPHHGSSSGNTDNLHINVDAPNYSPGAISCKSGCDPKDVMLSFRQRAQDANDPLWNAEIQRGDRRKASTSKTREEFFAEYEPRRKENAKFKFTRTPDLLIDKGQFTKLLLSDLPTGIIAWKGGQGTGKTYAMNYVIAQFSGRILQIGHLNSLLQNSAKRGDLVHHQKAKETFGYINERKLAITDISTALHLPTSQYENEPFALKIDEVEQVLESLVNNQNLKGTMRLEYRIKLEWFIRNATYIFIADADLSDATLAWIERIRGDGRKAFIIQNNNKIGSGRKLIKISTNKGATLQRMYAAKQQGYKILNPCETIGDAKAIENEVNDSKNHLVIHGDNSSEPEVKRIIENIDSEYLNYQIFTYTGSLGTGVDLSERHYDKCFAFFTGDVFAFNQQIQQLKRYRPDLEIEIYCSPIKRTLPIDAEQIILDIIGTNNESESYFINNISNLIEAGLYPNRDGSFSDEDQAFLQLCGALRARKNASRANPLQTLTDELAAIGYEIEFIDEDNDDGKATLDRHKEIKKQMKDEEDIATSQARLLSDDEYKDYKKQKGNLNKQQQRELAKTYLNKTLGIDITPTIVKLERTKKISKGLQLLHVLLTDEASAIAYEMRDKKNNPIVTDRTYWLKARSTLKDLKITEFLSYLNDGNSYKKGDDWVKFIAKEARIKYKSMEKWLGIKIKFDKNNEGNYKQSDTEIIGLILAKLGIQMSSRQPRSQKQIRTYEPDRDFWTVIFNTILPHIDTEKPKQEDYTIIEDCVYF